MTPNTIILGAMVGLGIAGAAWGAYEFAKAAIDIQSKLTEERREQGRELAK